MPTLHAILASTRPGRAGEPIAEHTKAWSARIDAADAFVFVTPEYNYGFTAPGTRAVQMLKQVVTTLKMLPIFEAVNIPFHTQFIDEEGRVTANDVMVGAATAMRDELVLAEAMLRPLREAIRTAEAA
jgi:NAD(P)H-dependent FMN reductase